jgi:hypothetical protein
MATTPQPQPVLENHIPRVYALYLTKFVEKATHSAVFRKAGYFLAFASISNANPPSCSKLKEHHAFFFHSKLA